MISRIIGYLLGSLGILFWAVSIAEIREAFIMDTTVAGQSSTADGTRVANMLLMQQQMILIDLAIACAVIGTIMLCTSAVIGSIRRNRSSEAI